MNNNVSKVILTDSVRFSSLDVHITGFFDRLRYSVGHPVDRFIGTQHPREHETDHHFQLGKFRTVKAHVSMISSNTETNISSIVIK